MRGFRRKIRIIDSPGALEQTFRVNGKEVEHQLYLSFFKTGICIKYIPINPTMSELDLMKRRYFRRIVDKPISKKYLTKIKNKTEIK